MKLKKGLQEKIINLYFELFVLGVEENIFDENKLAVLQPIINKIHSKLALTMLEIFLNVVRGQLGKHIHWKCKNILNEAI